jgi:predicted ATPase
VSYDIFISHSSRDRVAADAVCAALERHGFRCWIAPRDIVPGTDWSAAIVDGLIASRATVLIFSAHANASLQVRREVQFTCEQGRALLPLRIDETVPESAMAYYLKPVHWLDAGAPPLERHLDALAAVVRRVLQTAEEAPASHMASAAPASIRGHVPAPITPFIGREAQIAAWQELLLQPATRLLTLVGFGGMGKSRSALELATRCIGPGFPEGVWWVELHEATTSVEMLERIALALALEVAPQQPLRDQVAARLNRRLLLVLDNTEQIADAGTVVSALLKAAPSMTCLVASRCALEVSGERAVEVLPLAPEEAQALFIERAQARSAAFESTEANRADIRELCRRLEGMPLAIELAASRIAGMTPRDMLGRLEDRFRLLQTRSPDLPPRQRALTGAIEWSHALLTEDDQRLFSQLSVFASGFTLPAAEEVCDVYDVFEGVHELRRHSFLRAETPAHTQQMRFFMLELVREYAAGKLSDAEFHQRHARYFLDFAEERAAAVRTPDEARALAEMALELDNLRAALDWSRKSPDRRELCARLALALQPVLHRHGFWSELESCLEAGLAAADDPPEGSDAAHVRRRALLRRYRSSLAHDRGDLARARTDAETALALYQTHDDTTGVADTLNLLGVIATDSAETEAAQRLFEQALGLRAPEDHHGRALSLHNFARLASRREDVEASRRLYKESLAERRAAGDVRGAAETSGNLGVIAYKQGQFAEARRLYEESLRSYRALGDPQGVALMCHNLAEIAEQDGDAQGAVRLLCHAERIFRELQSAYAAAPIEALARLSEAMGEAAYTQARREAAQSRLEEIYPSCDQ